MIVTQPDRVLLQQQLKKYGHLLQGDLLDVGSGQARRYIAVLPNVKSYKTLDYDPSGKPDIVASAEKIPVPDGTFDSILCTQVLEHVERPHKVLAEFHRILRPNGLCLLTVPQMNELHEVPRDFLRYTNYGLKSLFEDAGFTVEAMDQRGKYHATMMQQRIRLRIDKWQPYKNKVHMLWLAPISKVLTSWALWRDSMSTSEAHARHAIGWCVVAKKK